LRGEGVGEDQTVRPGRRDSQPLRPPGCRKGVVTADDMKTSTLAVVNPAAGFGKCAKLLGPALDRLRASGVRFDVAETKRAGHGIEIARSAFREGYRKFIAVGGDGTSFEIVNGLFPEAASNSIGAMGASDDGE